MFQSIHIKKIIINNSNAFTVNKILNSLPNYRSERDPGVLDIIGIDSRLQVDIELADSKYWKLRIKKEGILNPYNTQKIKNITLGNIKVKQVHTGDIYL